MGIVCRQRGQNDSDCANPRKQAFDLEFDWEIQLYYVFFSSVPRFPLHDMTQKLIPRWKSSIHLYYKTLQNS